MTKTAKKTTPKTAPAKTATKTTTQALAEVTVRLEELKAAKRKADEAQEQPALTIQSLEAQAADLRRSVEEETRRVAFESLDRAEADAGRALDSVDAAVANLAKEVAPLARVVDAADDLRRSLGAGPDTSRRLRSALVGALVRWSLIDSGDLIQPLVSISALDPHEQKAAKARAERQAEADREAEAKYESDPVRLADHGRRYLLVALRNQTQSWRLYHKGAKLKQVEDSLAAIRTRAALISEEDGAEILGEAGRLVRGLPVAFNVEGAVAA